MNNLPENWDKQQQNLAGSILQSRVWAEVQLALGRRIFFDADQKWSWLGFENKTKGFCYLMIPYGPTIVGEEASAFASITKTAKQQGFDFVRLEPHGTLSDLDIRKSGAIKTPATNPQHTHLIDLRGGEEELRKSLGSSLRNLINSTERRGLKIVVSDSASDLGQLFAMLDETAQRAGVKFHTHDYLKTVWEAMRKADCIKLYMALHDGQPVAGALFYDYNGVRYYAHAGAKQELNRKLNASTSLLWQAIIDAQGLGMHTFDMWGVAPDNDPKHKWAGISAFKRSFGGSSVAYPGTYDIPIKKSKYRLYRSLRALRGQH